ncbi:MAG: trehalase family glycosidase [Acidimicrobiia bacterium]
MLHDAEMPDARRAELVADAEDVLARNRRDGWTCPSGALYPHQWLWDSCFIAIGLAHVDPGRAADELRSLLRGQWDNGMLPNMIFAPGSRDLGSRTIWRSRTHEGAPRDVDTTCITQPPLLAIATARVAAALDEPARAAFLAELYPRIVAHHQWLYRERDLEHTGLVTLIHPWECGLDSTPPWMAALRRMRMPWWLRAAERLHLARLLRRLRYDTRLLPAAERTTDDDGLRMLAAAVHAKRYGFELRRMPRDGGALLQDVAFNAMLAAANRALRFLAGDLGETLPPSLDASIDRTTRAIEDLWDDDIGQYCSRDAVTGELVAMPTIATFLPLWAGVPTGEHAARLLAQLRDRASFWPAHPVPSVPIDAHQFRPVRYWKGPTWVNTNGMLVDALYAYGEGELAEQLRERTLALVATAGFHEYFSPLDGSGHGADDFSWTAALTIDLALD